MRNRSYERWQEMFLSVLMAVLVFVTGGANTVWAEPVLSVEPAKLQQLRLPDAQGEVRAVFADSTEGYVVVCFLGSECPLAKLYGSRLQELADRFADQQVTFLGVNSNLQDTREQVAVYAREHGVRFTQLKDYDHRLADLLGASRTPEVVVLDAAGQVRYRGRIDDQYLPGAKKNQPTVRDLETALQELTSGQAVTTPLTEPVGCLIGRAFQGEITTKITYSKEISRLMQRHCVECHRSGEIGPFALDNYDELLGWAEMSLEVIDQGRMPPWHASPKHGQFANARGMSETDKQLFRDWVQGGMPYGDAAELPQPQQYLAGWQLDREPGLVLEMSQQPFRVPAEGVVEYQYFVVDPKFETDQWVTGAQVLPGNRAVVHHCIVFIRPPDGTELQGLGWLSAYVPGQRSTMLPAGHGRHVPAGSRLVFQMHYTPVGKEQFDKSKLGLLLTDASQITHQVYTLPAINRNFEIPPENADFAVRGATSRIPQNGTLLALAPHMHYRGKAFRAEAVSANGTQILLDVPQYDFNWQHVYEMTRELPLADIDRLEFECRFDNSKSNPFNPDPTRYVTWGDQTWEEMAIAFFEIAVPRGEKPQVKEKPVSAEEQAAREQHANEKRELQAASARQHAAEFIARFDKNRDGLVQRTELPTAQQRYGFKQLDRNGDGQIDASELEAAYRERAAQSR